MKQSNIRVWGGKGERGTSHQGLLMVEGTRGRLEGGGGGGPGGGGAPGGPCGHDTVLDVSESLDATMKPTLQGTSTN